MNHLVSYLSKSKTLNSFFDNSPISNLMLNYTIPSFILFYIVEVYIIIPFITLISCEFP